MITVLRHCEALDNVTDKYGKDTKLTYKGILQAREISGYYDYVLCSPMARCKETLINSKIDYKYFKTTHLLREYVKDICDLTKNEKIYKETENELIKRVDELKCYLKSDEFEGMKILLITHADLIWYLTSKEKIIYDNKKNKQNIKKIIKFGKWLTEGEILVIDDILYKC